uniref:Galectin n=1 Tax=Amphilophus citrinellus TaxID=61819 RepID=A0A3Q0R6F1_AMPCI
PSLPPSGAGFPAWPGQATQPAPCWTGQPNTPCWPGTQPPCQPCWPGIQYQPPQPPAPIQAQLPNPTPAPVPGPATSIHPSVPGWPAHPGWPYNPGQSGWPGQNPSIMPPHWLPPTSGPLVSHMQGTGRASVLSGYFTGLLSLLFRPASVYLLCLFDLFCWYMFSSVGNDIAFHINPRFNEGAKQVVVRNHKLGERWGAEERDLKGPFPFALGSPFEMKILCTPEAFRVAVNNIPLFEFRHRIRELNQIDRINILHDVVLTYINVETLP